MGKSEEKYSVPDPNFEPKDGETVPYRSTLLEEDEELVETKTPGIDTLKRTFLFSVEQYADDEFLGTRTKNVSDDDSEVTYGKYKWKTYQEIHDECFGLAKSIVKLNLFNEVKVESRRYRLLGIYGKNSEGWVETDIACWLSNIGVVTLYDTLGANSTEYIIEQTKISTIACTSDHIDTLIEIKERKNFDFFQNLIVLDEYTDEQEKRSTSSGLKLYSLDTLIEEGKEISIELDNPTKNDLFTICYTSGTTGNPKGVMLTHGNIIALGASQARTPIDIQNTDVHLSYLPLAHIMERITLVVIIQNGASCGFYQGDVLKLREDLSALKPTIFVSVPRLYSRFYDLMQATFRGLKGIKGCLAKRAINAKLQALKKNGTVTHCLYDKLVFKKTRAVLGGRVRLCITGSAPISPEILDFMKIAFSCEVFEGYGQTELCGATNITMPKNTVQGHVGGPIPSFLMKLQDVPDMDYYSTDVGEDGEPLPRGEVCYKGPPAFIGYFKEPEKTAEAIDKEGWVHTGDIGAILPNGSLKIIDRKKNIFKLAQGEYIAAEKLEIMFAKSPLIKQIFVYGDSLQSFLVTIVVPDEVEVAKLEEDTISDYQSYINEEKFHSELKDWFTKVKGEENLNGLEIPKKIYCTEKEFSVEDGTLTPTFKLVRAEAKKLYIDQIREMYEGAKLQGDS